jgi:hypothetical protein
MKKILKALLIYTFGDVMCPEASGWYFKGIIIATIRGGH